MQILVVWAIMILLGLFAMYSVSVFESFSTTLRWVEKWLRQESSNYYYFFEQLWKLGIGIIIGFLITLLPWRFIKRRKYIIFVLTLVGVLLLFTKLGTELNNSRAWLLLFGGTIQPWEFFKIWFVLFLGSRLLRKREVMNELTRYIGFLIITGVCYLVFVLVPDLGTVYVLAPVSLVMFWYAGGKPRYIFTTLVLGVAAMWLASLEFSYIGVRVDYFLHPAKYENDREVGRQNKQALLAVGGGWRIGKGYGKGLQKFGYLPEAQSDFIFAALAEEVGLIGNTIILGLYILLAWLVLRWLPKVKDEEDQLIAVGLISLIVMQAFINIGVNIGLLPLTWLTLPFFSHGGSALLANILELVFLQKIVQQK